MSAIFISMKSNQVYGKMYGKAILDDGTALKVDGLMVFCERVRNRY
jgi:hypothetical protein